MRGREAEKGVGAEEGATGGSRSRGAPRPQVVLGTLGAQHRHAPGVPGERATFSAVGMRGSSSRC